MLSFNIYVILGYEAMTVTLREVAKKAGVSPSTVSLVIRGKGPNKRRFSSETIERIRSIANAMGYRRNLVAANLVNSQTHTIGVLIAGLTSGFYEYILAGIKREIYPAFTPVLAVHNYDGFCEQTELEVFIGSRVDGVVAAFSGDTESIPLYRELSEKYKIPVVLIDRGIPGMNLPVVRNDHYASTYKAVKALRELGHQRILYACLTITLESVELYKQGYCTAMREEGLEDQIQVFSRRAADYRNEKKLGRFAGEIIDFWEASEPSGTALLVHNDWLAYEILAECKRRQIKVPEDLSIMGIDDQPLSSLSVFDLSTVKMDFEMIGCKAAKLLLKILRGEPLSETQIVLPVEVVMRKTTKAI